MTVELSAAEIQVCWRELRLGELPVVIDVPALGRTEAERRHLMARTLDGLRERHLVDAGGVHPDLTHLLRVLARYQWAVEAWLLLERPVRALAACRGEAGAMAVLEGERVRLTPCASHSVLDQLIRLAGVTAGPGQSVTVRAESLDAATLAAGRDMRRLADELVRQGERHDDAQELARMCTDHGRLGQFGVLVRDQLGTQRTGRRVVGLHSTPRGWYSQLRRASHGGTYVTVTPAGPDVVRTQLRDLLAETRRLAG